jgi:hypothetical protein
VADVRRGDDELDLDDGSDDGSDDEIVLVCMRVADLIGTVAKGSTIIECDRCHRLIWIGPVEHALAEERTYYDRVVCTVCAAEEQS